jgi:hypothetical protein
MRTRGFMRLIAIPALAMALLGGFSTSTVAQEEVRFVYHRIAFHSQQVELAKADGSKARAEFVSEMILLPDGRANGGFGLWEQGGPERLVLYRMVEGRAVNRSRNFYEFKARRLSPPSADEITINLRPAQGHTPAGSVTFFIDGPIATDGQPLSFTAEGRVRPANAPIASVTDLVGDPFSYINAPPQTVVVETRAGNYNAVFEHVALVFPSGESIGFASLSQAEGVGPIEIRYTGGRLHFDNEEFDWGLLHGRANSKGRAQPLPVLMVLADQHDVSEPCRIYDILGWQGRMAHFEAETTITRLTFESR